MVGVLMKGKLAPIFFGALSAALLLGGCTQPPPPRPPPRPPKLVTPPLPPPPKAGPEMLNAVTIDALDELEAHEFFARRKDGALLVFVRGGRLLSRAAALDGTPKAAQAVDIGAAPGTGAELALGTLRPSGDGYVFAWAENEGGRTKLAVLALDAAGAPRGQRADVAESSDEVVSIEVLPREGGSLLVWSVGRGTRVDVTGIALTDKGAAAGPVTRLVAGALSFDFSASGGAIAAVVPADAKDTEETGTVQKGRVQLIPLDAAGKPKPTIEVSGGGTAQPDVVLAEVGNRWVLAWTDEREIDAAVYTAAVERNGIMIGQPKRATPPTGEQALIAIAAGEGGPQIERGLLVWEDVLRAPADIREMHLATLGSDGTIGKERTSLSIYGDGSRPSLSADGSGFAAITLARAWQGGAPPEEAPILPTFVRFAPDLSVLSAEPIRAEPFGADGVPYLVHELACTSGACSTVGLGAQRPAKVAVVSLVSRKTEWYPPARRDPDDAPPRAAALAALYDGGSISRIAVTPASGGGELAAWVTYFAEGDAAKNKRDGGAEVAVLPVAPGAKGVTAPIFLSKKAVSIGGIAVEPAVGGNKEIAIAWVGREKGESQVYITKVDESGKKLAQKKLTVVPRMVKGVAPSEASDVSLAWSPAEFGEGWIVSWVDTRDGNAEVYAAKVDRALNRAVPDRRVTEAPGDAAEVHLLTRGKETLVAWSDARQKPEEGKGDIFLGRLETRGLTKLAPEVRLAVTPAHSRTPQLVAAPGNAVWVSWIEDAGDGTDGAGALRIAVLDDKGAAVTTTSLAGGPKRAVISAALACGDKACRGVVAEASPEALLIEALELSPAAQPKAGKTLLTLPGAGGVDISPVFADRAATTLFFGADATSGTGRVRRVKIDW